MAVAQFRFFNHRLLVAAENCLLEGFEPRVVLPKPKVIGHAKADFIMLSKGSNFFDINKDSRLIKQLQLEV